MHCKSFSIYLVINRLGVSKAHKNKVQNAVLVGKTLLIKILRNLSKLLKPEKWDLKSVKMADERLILLEWDLIAMIIFKS